MALIGNLVSGYRARVGPRDRVTCGSWLMARRHSRAEIRVRQSGTFFMPVMAGGSGE